MDGVRKRFLISIRQMSDETLKKRLKELQVELMKYRSYGESTGIRAIPPHPMHIHNLRKDIARIKTILRERELQKRR